MLALGLASLLAALGASAGWAGSASAAARRTPTLSPANTVIDGPTAGIDSLNGMSIARDGTGGVVYLKDVDGVAHVFVSRLLGGSFQPPQQVDAGMAAASSQPVLAAGQTGVMLVAFINAGALYVAQAPDAQSPVAAPTLLFEGAINPSLSMSTFGKGYLAFTAAGGPNDVVRAAFYYQGQWGLEPTPLNADPSADAGINGGRPQVVACGDGVAIVAWGEGGHIYTRRVVGTTASVVYQQADPPVLDGVAEISASDPMISSGGDSSYASVTFQEQLATGPKGQSRVLMNHLQAGSYSGIFEADGDITEGAEGADQPQTAVTEYGTGWVTSERDQSHELFAAPLGTNAVPGSVERVDSSPNTAAPDAVPATAGLVSTLIAWQQTPGISGPAEVRVRYAPNGSDLGPEQVVSSPALGDVDGAAGLVAGGDVAGDAAIAWVQGSGADQQIVAGQLYQSPGSFVPMQTFGYSTSAQPVLSWSTSAESWGLPGYGVEFDGAPIAQTSATQVTTPAPVANGPHTWEVTATNQAGLTTAAHPATVFVDTVAPRATLRLTGRRVVGLAQRLVVTATDPPPPGAPPSVASGIGSIQVRWGDGARADIGRNAVTHVYRRAGSYTVTLTVSDRAGNRTSVTRQLTIRPRPATHGRARRTRHRKRRR